MKKNKIIIIFTVIMLTFTFYVPTLMADTVNDYKKKSNNLKKEQEANSEKISNVDSQVKQDLKAMEDLDAEISKYDQQLNELQEKEDEANAKLKEYENNLQNSAQKYNSAEDVYSTRLRAIYENGIPNVVDVLINSEGIADFFSKMNIYSSVLEYDKSLIGNVQNEKEYIDLIKKQMEEEKAQLDQLTYDVEKSSKQLEVAKSNKEKKISELKSSKERLEAVNSELNKEVDALDAKIQQEVAAQAKAAAAAAAEAAKKNESSSGTSNGKDQIINTGGGQFQWPTPNSTRITAYFPAYPTGERHTGIDIGLPCGSPVYSAISGVVIKSTYYLKGDYDGGRSDGYGNTVWVSNGNYTVIYGHLRYNQLVKKGDYVQRGQLVAYSASTGYSTGAHLHFEIRNSNGVAINPMQFF